jgi:hypothetical protein
VEVAVTLPSDLDADQGGQRPAAVPDTDEDVIIGDPEEDVEEVAQTAPDDELADPARDLEAGNLAVNEESADEQSAVAQPAEPADQYERSETTEHWQNIQALFVDDPRGSVELALQAVDGALATFVDGLREQQAALTPDARLGDTERLRATLRSSRAFCENLVRLGDQLRSSD